MNLKEVVEKNEKVSGYRDKIKKARDEYEGLIQEFFDEKENCSHELVINFGEELHDKPCKSGPCNAHYCLSCVTYKSKPIYMDGPVEWFPEDIDRIENEFPFANSEMLYIRKKNGELIHLNEQLPLVVTIKNFMKIALDVNPDLTVSEFCDLLNLKMSEYTLEIGENQRVKVRR